MRSARFLIVLLLPVLVIGCRSVKKPDYARPLPPGQHALRKITDPADLPDLTAAFRAADSTLTQALDRSIAWFDNPSTQQFFPICDITHEHAQASARAFRQIFLASGNANTFQQTIRDQFDTYTSVGWDGSGVVYFTGYYSPIFDGSRTATAQYRYPLYTRPDDLVSDSTTGRILGRNTAAGLSPYPTRRQIESSDPAALGLAGHELVWLKHPLDAYFIHVNGSAKIHLPDGSFYYVGYAGSNGRDYISIGRLLVRDGKISGERVSLPAIRDYFARHPDQINSYVLQNDRYIFFREYPADNWPSGSLGFPVTPWRSVATDKSIYPRASALLVQTQVPTVGSGGGMAATRPYVGFALDQDTGGAIRAPGRADLYMGVGPQAEQIAGRQAAEGRLYYLFLKPEHLPRWLNPNGYPPDNSYD